MLIIQRTKLKKCHSNHKKNHIKNVKLFKNILKVVSVFEILFSNLLKQTLGPNARFKEGQYESIASTINNHFTLVVQKTGWGKSMVYFLATKYFRQNDYGPTIIVSPLLSLMRNQKEAAEK